MTTRYRDAIIASAPVAYWRLGEPAGPVALDELWLHPAAYIDGVGLPDTPVHVPGALPSDPDSTGVAFDGVGVATYKIDVPAALSYVVWARGAPDRFIGGMGNVNPFYSSRLWMTPWGFFRLELFDVAGNYHTWFDGAAVVTDGAWHMIAATFDGVAGAIYVDGVLSDGGQGPLAGAWNHPAGAPSVMGGFFVAQASDQDEWAVWDRIVTPAEIAAWYALAVEVPAVPGPIDARHAELAAALEAAGVRVGDIALPPTPPVALIRPADPWITPVRVGGGLNEVRFSVLLIGGPPSSPAAVPELEALAALAVPAIRRLVSWSGSPASRAQVVELDGGSYLVAELLTSTLVQL